MMRTGALDHLLAFTIFIYYTSCFVLVDHSVCREPISILINAFTLLALCLLSTMLVLTLTMCQLHQSLFIARCCHKATVVIRRMGALDCLHDFTSDMYYTLCFALVEHSVCYELSSVLINVSTLLA